MQHIDDSEARIVGGQAVPRIAGVKQPLLYMAIVPARICWLCSLNGQAVLVGRHPLKLQAGIWPCLFSGAAVSVPENGIVANGKHTLPLPLIVSWLVIIVAFGALHVPGHGETGVSGRLGRNATTQSDRVGLCHCHV